MSTSPTTLRELGAYWQSQGGVNLGIVGDMRHCTGYHLGADRINGDCACRPKGSCIPGKGAQDYSVQHPRDRAGLSNAASAIDLGALGGSFANLQRFSRWLVAQCQAGVPGTDDIREIVYSPDGTAVQRYSGIDGQVHSGPGNGDASHRTHTHISYFRDSERRDKRPVFARYFGLPATDTEEDMELLVKAEDWTATSGNGVLRDIPSRDAPVAERLPDGTIVRTIAEAYTLPRTDPQFAARGNWRVTRHGGRTRYLLRNDWRPLVAGGDPVTDAAFGAFISRVTTDCTTAEAAAHNAALEAAAAAVASVPRR